MGLDGAQLWAPKIKGKTRARQGPEGPASLPLCAVQRRPGQLRGAAQTGDKRDLSSWSEHHLFKEWASGCGAEGRGRRTKLAEPLPPPGGPRGLVPDSQPGHVLALCALLSSAHPRTTPCRKHWGRPGVKEKRGSVCPHVTTQNTGVMVLTRGHLLSCGHSCHSGLVCSSGGLRHRGFTREPAPVPSPHRHTPVRAP